MEEEVFMRGENLRGDCCSSLTVQLFGVRLLWALFDVAIVL